MEKSLRNKKRDGKKAALSVLVAAMFAVTLFSALTADYSGDHEESGFFEDTSLGAELGGSTAADSGVKMIAAGFYHTLILKSDGTVWAWGNNYMGQLGDGTDTDRSTPVQVLGEGGIGYLDGVTAVAAGRDHSLALRSDGTVWAWGANNCGELGNGISGSGTHKNTPAQVLGEGGIGYLDGVTAIAGGWDHSLALKSDGTVWTWGHNWYGQLGDGTNTDRSTPVQVLDKDGIGYLDGVTAIATRSNCSLALKSDGTVWAWGWNEHGQFGDGTFGGTESTPVQVLDKDGIGHLTDVTAIAAGHSHTLALKSDGTVWVWGYNDVSQLGDGTDTQRNTPVQVSGKDGIGYLNDVKAIAAGYSYSLALKSDGTVWSWGRNGYSQLGIGMFVGTKSTPVQVLGEDGIGYLNDVKAIAAGSDHSLAFKGDGTVWAWGRNDHGQLGDGTTTNRSAPVQVLGEDGTDHMAGVTVIAAGGHSLALKSDGTVWAWGWNDYGQLGDGTTTNRNTSVQVAGEGGIGYLDGVIAIAVGDDHSLALKSDGTVWAWGHNNHGQLGDGTTTDRSAPVQVPGLTDVTAITRGENQSFALKSDGTVWAWGANFTGQLGDGTETDRSAPVQVLGENGTGYLEDVKAISGGGRHVLALKSDGTVWSWGNNDTGQLGDGTGVSKNVPVQVSGLTGMTAVSGGTFNSFALKSDGTVWSWGWNPCGALGDGTETDRSAPVQVLGENGTGYLKDVKAISGGGQHAIALKSDGTVWSWGNGNNGCLGDGTNTHRNTPVQVSGLTDVTMIIIGIHHSLALKSDGNIWSWGMNTAGQLGDGTNTNRDVPVHTHFFGTLLLHDETDHWYECSCGAKNGAGHTYGTWTIDVSAGHLTDGSKHRVCTVCSYNETATIPAEGHSFNIPDHNGSSHWYECVCGVKDSIEGHTFGNWTIDLSATHISDGSRHRVCAECSYIETTAIPAEGHNFSDPKQNASEHWYECSCGAKNGVEGHAFGTEHVHDASEHWYQCSCGAKDSVEGHAFGTERVHNASEHWYQCSCGERTDVQKHAFAGNSDDDECSCGITYGEIAGGKEDGSASNGFIRSNTAVILIVVMIAVIALACIIAKKD